MLRIGATAFGGGSATIVALRRTVLRRGWLTEAEFIDTVVLSRLTPGITILAQALLIGRKVAGVRGMIAALAGMLCPSVVITIALTRLYQYIHNSPDAARPLQCLAGAAAGFAVALFLQLLRDTLRPTHRWRGTPVFALYATLGALIGTPEIVLAAAVATGVAVPHLFEPREAHDES